MKFCERCGHLMTLAESKLGATCKGCSTNRRMHCQFCKRGSATWDSSINEYVCDDCGARQMPGDFKFA